MKRTLTEEEKWNLAFTKLNEYCSKQLKCYNKRKEQS